MLRNVHLMLARCTDYPDGSTRHGYNMQLPLDDTGRLDLAAWGSERPVALFRKFWGDEDDRWGELRHDGSGWWLVHAEDETRETLLKADQHRFAPGEYVSIGQGDSVVRTFRIYAVEKPPMT